MIFDINKSVRPDEILLKAELTNAYGIGGFSRGKCVVIVTPNKIIVNFELINQQSGDTTVESRTIMSDSIRELSLVQRKGDRVAEYRVFLAYCYRGDSHFSEILQVGATPMNIQTVEAVYNCILKTLKS